MATNKWDMAALIARHRVKVQPEDAGWSINHASSVRRMEGVGKAGVRVFCERPERATRLTCARNWIQATVRLLRES